MERRRRAVFGVRRGIALPTVLLLITLLSVLAAGAMTLVGDERRVVGNDAAATQAAALARSGLDRFLSSRDSLGFTSEPPAAVESVRVVMRGGFADVIMEQIRQEQGLSAPALYVVRSRGVQLDRSARPRPIAERIVAQYARWQRPAMPVLAAWTSLSGINKQGSAGALSGIDACGAAVAVGGVAVPAVPGYSQSAGPPLPVGSPNVLDLGIPATATAAVTVDWAAVVNHGIAAAAVRLPGGTWPNGAQWSNPTFWPVIVVRGNFTIPSDGRGLLVVTGDVTLPAMREWDGILLAGGSLTATGGATISGAALSGLNAKVGVPNAAADQVAGTFVAQYNSCSVASALVAFGGLAPMRNATIDRWSY